ncbi:MAG: hypothetical protein ABIP39_13330 [Polyangiaceae bacterium]
MKRLSRALVLLAALSVTPIAFGQGRDPRAATEFFTRGRDAVKKSDYVTACPFFAESHRLDPKVGTLLNLADCEEHVGQLASARQHWQQAADLAQSLADERANVAKERFTAVDKRVPKLILRAPPNAPAGMVVKRDGIEFSAVGFGIPLPADPGDHTIVITAPGQIPRSFHIDLKEGEQKEVQLDLTPRATDAPVPVVVAQQPPPVAEQPKPKPEEPASSGSSRKTLAYAVGGVGVIGLGAGAIFGLMASSKNSESNDAGHCDTNNACDPTGKTARNAALSDARISTVAFVLGGVALAAGVVLYVTAPTDSKGEHKSVGHLEAGAQVGPGSGTFSLKGTW